MANNGYTTEIVYPYTDEMAMDDGIYQVPIYLDVTGSFRVLFSKVPRARVNGNTFLYFTEGNPLHRVAPDCYVLFNLSDEGEASIKRHNTYLLWEVGKPPDFVLEIGSPSTVYEDLYTKREIYAMMGIQEYWRYDQTGGRFYGEPLVGERLVDGEYQRLQMRGQKDGPVWARSDALNLDLWWIDGELRIYDPVRRRWKLSYEEMWDAQTGKTGLEPYEAYRAAEARLERIAVDALEARVARLQAEVRRLSSPPS